MITHPSQSQFQPPPDEYRKRSSFCEKKKKKQKKEFQANLRSKAHPLDTNPINQNLTPKQQQQFDLLDSIFQLYRHRNFVFVKVKNAAEYMESGHRPGKKVRAVSHLRIQELVDEKTHPQLVDALDQ